MTTLTKKELAWIDKVNKVLEECPNKEKLGVYSIGDCTLNLYDLRKTDQIYDLMDSGTGMDFCAACKKLDAEYDVSLKYHSPVQGVAG